MTLTRADFADFFSWVNHGRRPFAWQERLVDHLVSTGSWPATIAAPTGAGKSSVVDVHVFANALFAFGGGPRVPRRLAAVVGRRALVDSQAVRARHIKRCLSDAVDGVGVAVREALSSLVAGAADADFLPIAPLRGGLPPTSAWLDDPRACAVINATPDMWGSRLLLRGYGSTRNAWPREAGLLAFDAALILDEAHLNQQLLLTARTVALWAGSQRELLGIPSLQVVETTATPADSSGGVIGVKVEDLVTDHVLAERLTRPKPLTIVESPSMMAKGALDRRHGDLLVELVQELRGEHAERSVGCVVNRVETATYVAAGLEKLGLRTACWVGRMRPMDLGALLQDHPDVLDPSLPSSVDVIVATQTIEVGVDLDLSALVTELAPASALAQRAGRVNRRGARPAGPVVVVVPPPGDLADLPPYSAMDLSAARDWLDALITARASLAPLELVGNPPPSSPPRRGFLKRPERHDAMRWAVTSTPMLAEEDLELWLRDSLDPESQPVGVVLRGPLPGDDTVALALLRATPPSDEEVFPTSMRLARIVVGRVQGGTHGDTRVFRLRDDDVRQLSREDGSVRPGDVLIVPSRGHSLTRKGVLSDDPPDRVEAVQTIWGTGNQVVQPGEPDEDLLDELVGLSAEEAQLRYQDLVADGKGLPMAVQVVLPPPEMVDDALPWVVLRSAGVANDQEVDRQTWSVRPSVRLDVHSRRVRDRVRLLATDLGLDDGLGTALGLAGLHHDDGKDDPRFQRLLGATGEPLAKSGFESAQESRRAATQAGLPSGWRHEHRSAAHASSVLNGRQDKDLIVRLVGTSHGHGRGVPPQRGTDLVAPTDTQDLEEAARALFEEGAWAELVERTEAQYGIWGCAYLEAVLRSADCQVSKEGS